MCFVPPKTSVFTYGETNEMDRIESVDNNDYSIHPASYNPLVVGNSKTIHKPNQGDKMDKNKSWRGFKFKNKDLESLYTTRKGANNYPEAVVKGFFKAMQKIDAAEHEWDLYRCRSLRFHRLSGKRQDEYGPWLTGNWRLIVTIEEDATSRYVLIHNVEDYHP